MIRYVIDYLTLFLFSGSIVAADQLSKEWVRDNLGWAEIYRPDLWITQYVRIIHWRNTGSALGLFQNFGFLFTILSFIVGLAILFYFPRVSWKEWPLRLAMGLQLGGAIGNLIDRLMRGHVTDFISIGNFPVFNIADASISSGVVILLVWIWLRERRQKEAAPATDTETKEAM